MDKYVLFLYYSKHREAKYNNEAYASEADAREWEQKFKRHGKGNNESRYPDRLKTIFLLPEFVEGLHI